MKEIALVYPVAGMSSRFGGKIKQFAEIGPDNETLIEYSINQALKSAFSKIIFIVGEKTEQSFKKKFRNFYKGIPVFYAFQSYDKNKRDKPWGTSDALCSAKEIINNDFIICNGDDIYGENSFKILFNHLQKNNEGATLGYKLINVLPEKGSVNRAFFKIKEFRDKKYVEDLKEIFNIEKSNLELKTINSEDLCSMNIFALPCKTIDLLYERLKLFKIEHENDRKKECLLPNEISELIKNKKLDLRIYSATDKWFGITNPEDEKIVKDLLKNSNK